MGCFLLSVHVCVFVWYANLGSTHLAIKMSLPSWFTYHVLMCKFSFPTTLWPYTFVNGVVIMFQWPKLKRWPWRGTQLHCGKLFHSVMLCCFNIQ